MASISFHFSRTTSMAVSNNKKRSLDLPHRGPRIFLAHPHDGATTGASGRRHTTLHPRRRDSVLSNGSSDRSSSQSDDAFLSPLTFPESSTIHSDVYR